MEIKKMKAMKSNLFLGLCAAVLLLTGCCGCRSHQKRTQRPLIGTEWKLVQLGGRAVEGADADSFTLRCAETGDVSGKGACNRLMGSYQVGEDRSLKIGPLGATRMMCPDMDSETQFFQMLDGVTHYDMDGPMLMLLDEGSLVAVFQAADSETK